jgi:hypothetical protein
MEEPITLPIQPESYSESRKSSHKKIERSSGESTVHGCVAYRKKLMQAGLVA